ncbi:ras association domain-containing protein 7-like [Oncorhynchus clarkii lewisi]|uniref:ras association domain-containing protein 7-like n=1 Tax=Oncorhynchus clarkii lewisi TaxID=490388 RepID=UPI0039B83300
MELKVWVDGVVRVVCGLSLETSCQDVVIALAQAIGQTGRYVLIQKLRGTEMQLVADDCPLESLSYLGQLAIEVQFILRRTGPSSTDGPNRPTLDRVHPLLRHPTPIPSRCREPKKALTFNLGPSTIPRRTKANKAWSPSPRASPEPRASPVPSLVSPTASPPPLSPSDPSKEEVFRQVLQQQEMLQDLESHLVALEREAEVWEMGRPVAPVPGLNPGLVEEMDVLETRLRQNEAELHGDYWEKQMQQEKDKEQDIQGHLHQLYASMDEYNFRLKDLQSHSSRLGQDFRVEARRRSSRPGTPQPEEALGPLREELHNRLQKGAEVDMSLTETKKALQTAELRLQERCEALEELNKELRQCNLQQFILQTGVPPSPSYSDHPLPDQTHPHLQPIATPYLCIAGLLEDDQTDTLTIC